MALDHYEATGLLPLMNAASEGPISPTARVPLARALHELTEGLCVFAKRILCLGDPNTLENVPRPVQDTLNVAPLCV